MFCSVVMFCSVLFFCSVVPFCSGVKLTYLINRIFNTCNKELDEKNYLKNRTVCKNCYNKNRRKNNNNNIFTQNQPPKIEKDNKNKNDVNNSSITTYENHAYVVIGPGNVGKTYYMLKILEKIGNKKPIHIITRLPNQYPNYQTSKEIKPMNKYKGGIVIINDMLWALNSSQIDEFFTRGRHELLTVFYISQSFFGSPRQSISNNSDRLILFKQT